MRRLLTLAGLLAVPAAAAAADDPEAFFEKKVRPVFATHCQNCHSAAAGKTKGGLALDTRDGVRTGGDSGPVIVPGKPDESLLMKAVRHGDKKLKMPPKGKLPDEMIADLERWVKLGAPDPREPAAAKAATKPVAAGDHWAFRKPAKTAPPAAGPGVGEIDQFLRAKLRDAGLKPSPEADRRTLARRLSFDLLGLPPAPEDVETFVNDMRPDAYERLVDRLLASPAFGERWGRHWLDVARYGESTGKSVNFNYPTAWRYRDYVVKAFNRDKPYDQFVREQIAGDLLPADGDAAKAEQLVATGFLAIGPKSLNERNRLQFEMDVIDEQIDTLTQAFLGVTVACARCHDHKFDPIPTADYYALAGIFRSTETCYGTVFMVQSQRPSPLITLPKNSDQPAGLEPLSAEGRKALERQLEEIRRPQQGDRLFAFIRQSIVGGNLRSRLDAYESDGAPKLRAMGVRERRRTTNSVVYRRGEIDKPGDTVPRGLPTSLGLKPPAVENGSGRKELAAWLTDPANPLTARVMVNRVWLHLFGRGLVPTPDNFGAAGTPPTHPELLDWLAVSFVEDGWSVKRLVKRLVTTQAYRQSSKADAAAVAVDPDNHLLWRSAPRRLDAESLRDALLSVSGRLDPVPPKVSPVAQAGEGYARGLGGGGGPRYGRGFAPEPRVSGRSVYLPVVRDALPEALALFDAADPSMVVGERPTTTVPSQGLFLLNSPFVLRASDDAAARLLALPGDDAARLRVAYGLFYGRPPTDAEIASGRQFLTDYTATLARTKGGTGPTEAWAALCQAMFASAEFLYVR
jgi:cytochrome c553